MPESTRSVQDEQGFNQGWSGGLSTKVRLDRRCDLIMTRMSPDRSKQVLEIGCGRGEIARRIAATTGMQVRGIDRSARFIQAAHRVATVSNLQFEVRDFTDSAEGYDGRFDYVIGNGILHHLYYELPTALLTIKRLLVEDGRLLFLEPNLHNPYVFLIFTRKRLRRLAKLEPDEMAFTRKFVIRQLGDAGFREIEVTYRDFLIPGVPRWLIWPLVRFGDMAERIPGLKHLAQSLFISARP